MKVKEVQRTANIAWSPAPQYPIYLAAGTAAQQLDATFSTSAALEIFSLNLSNSDSEMPLKGTLASEHRFHKLIWGSYGMDTSSLSSSAGILVGGSDNGLITLYDANKIILADEEPVVFKTTKHTGPVQALDFNPFQSSLLASGASDSEIYIWDLNKPTTPLSPGTKTLPPDNISCVSWNRQVQHILASTSPCGRCVVWDLRKNEPIIKVSDQSALIRCKAVEWHPDVATQMVLASEDDRYPVIQMWDLRFATSPMKVLEGHQRGILSIAWCPQDPDLLMSCAKDNRILCWNPNVQGPGGEIVYELPTTAQWSFDVAWCPRNPALICSSSFDGHVSVFSLMGGSITGQDLNQQKVMSAFDVDDPFGSQLHQAQQQQQQKAVPTSAPLKKPPKWLRRPCGATFAFGGKLISFGQSKGSPSSQVNISQVTTEQELVNRSYELEGALVSGSFIQYCGSKVENTVDELERTLWSFLKTNFEREPRRHFLTLLGYDPMQLSKKVASSYISSGPSGARGGVDAEELVQKMQLLTSGEVGRKSAEGVFSSGASTPSVTGSKTPLSDAGSLSEGAAAFDAIASGGPLTIDTNADFGVTEPAKSSFPFKIPTDNDTDGLITQALLTGNFEAAVDVCLHDDRMADAFLLAIAGGPDLLTRIQTSYFERSKSNVARLMSVVVNRDWRDIVESCVLENWREALAALVTYAKAEEFTSLCDVLGQRLEQEGDAHCANAMVCYICAGNVEKFVSCWSRNMPAEPSPLALQELIEKVMVLKKAVERERRLVIDSGSSVLAETLSKYSEILAAQGCLETAMGYLMASSDQASLGVLKDRLFNAQHPSHLSTSTAPPPFPFQRVDVLAEPLPQSQFAQQPAYGFPQQQPQQQQQHYQPQPQRPPTHPPAVSTYQPTLPPQQPQFYNPTTYQPPAPTVPQPSYSQVTPQQPPYFTGPSQPPAAATQSSWSQPPPVPMYQPQLANPGSSQGPSQGQYGSAVQMGGQSQPMQIYNPAASVTPGAPHSGPGAVGAPPVGPPPQGPIAPPPTAGPPPTEPPPLSGAWKDTHIMRSKKQQTQAYTPPAPITTPLFGVGDPSYQQLPPQQPSPVGMPQGVPPGHGGRPMVLQGGGPPGAPPSYGDVPSQQLPQVYDASPPPSPHQLTMPYQTHVPPAQEPAQPVIKGPIPAEHVVLQETFDGLVQRCKSTANNPLTKRKLEDVSKRLEALYDKLRDQKMSVPILEGLHEIAEACQNVDYPRGLMAHTGLISSGSFSEISTFMPGLKSLMQIATQLRV